MDVIIEIDELVIHGGASLDGAALEAAIGQAVARHLAQQGIPWQHDATVPHIEGGVSYGGSTEQVARQVADAITGPLSGPVRGGVR